MKKILSILMALSMLMTMCCGLSFTARAFTSGNYEYTVKADETIEITGYTGSGETIVNIPREFNTVRVTSIGDNAFQFAMDIISVTVPDSITSIGEGAFSNCFALEEVKISGSSLKKIGNNAFLNCALTEVSLPSSVTAVPANAFAECHDLKTIEVSSANAVYTAENGILYNKKKTTVIKVPAAYSGPELAFPKTVGAIGDEAIFGCKNLARIVLPKTLTSIGNNAISDNKSVTEILFLATQQDFDAKVSVGTGNDLSKLTCHNAHDWQTGEVIKTPTCEEDGARAISCPVCGETSTEPMEKLGHDFRMTSHKDASCTEDGVTVFTCSHCSDVKTETIPKTGHDYELTSQKAATCSSEGYKVFTCTNCGETKTEPIEKLSHDYQMTSHKDASCTEDGVIVFTCSHCSDVKTETIPKTGHDYELTSEKAATCSSEGHKVFTCSHCSDVKTETIPKTGHDYELTSQKAATCSSEGYKVFTCTNCGETKTETLAKTAHTPAVLKAVKPTFFATGKTRGAYCTKCKKILTPQKTVARLALPVPKTLQLRRGSRRFTAAYTKISVATGYQLQYSTTKNFTAKTTKTVKITGAKNVKRVVKKLKKKKLYYVRVRAYKTAGKRTVYSKWSATKSVKTK